MVIILAPFSQTAFYQKLVFSGFGRFECWVFVLRDDLFIWFLSSSISSSRKVFLLIWRKNKQTKKKTAILACSCRQTYSQEFSGYIFWSSFEGRPRSPLTSETGQNHSAWTQGPKNRDRERETIQKGALLVPGMPLRTHIHTHTPTSANTHTVRYI